VFTKKEIPLNGAVDQQDYAANQVGHDFL
jgi:hypothetical protein